MELVLAIVGLLIGVAGMILTAIALRARPTVSLDAPLKATDALSTPFVISNDGMLSLNDLKVIWYIREISYANGGNISRTPVAGFVPGSDVLETGERKTIPFPMNRLVIVQNSSLTRADLVLGIYFKPAYWPFKRHRLFHFVSASSPDGVRLQIQPADEITQEYEKRIAAN